MNNFNQRIANLSPAKRAILEQFLRKDTTVVNEQIVPRRRGASDPIALSFGQQRLWLLSQLSPDSPLYNLPKAVQLNGDLNTEALQQTFNTIVNRHEVLRTTFTSVDGSFVQITAPNQSIAVIMVDLDGLELRGLNEQLAVVKETTVQHLLNEAAQRPFNLSGDVMLRIILLRLDREDYVLLLINQWC